MAVNSSSFQQKLAAIGRAGFDVVEDNTLAARGEFTPRTFTYNPDTMTRLDWAHEWRHFSQINQAQDLGIKLDSQAFRAMKGPGEIGAYSYESRLWARAGLQPSDEYMTFHNEQLQSFQPQYRSFQSLTTKSYGQIWLGVEW